MLLLPDLAITLEAPKFKLFPRFIAELESVVISLVKFDTPVTSSAPATTTLPNEPVEVAEPLIL